MTTLTHEPDTHRRDGPSGSRSMTGHGFGAPMITG
jgi:hypothetical protein